MSPVYIALMCLLVAAIQPAAPDDQAKEISGKVIASAEKVGQYLNQVVTATAKLLEVTEGITKFTQHMAAAGPVFQAVSVAFSFISIFLPKPESPELQAIKAGFKEMRQRFDQLDKKVDDLKNLMVELFEEAEIHREFVAVVGRHIDKRANIRSYLRLQKTLIDEKTNSSYNSFKEACINDLPAKDLDWFFQHSVNEIEPTLLSAIFKYSSSNLKKLRWFFKIIVSDLTDLALVRHACLGMTGESEATIPNRVKETEDTLRQIFSKMENLENKLMNEFHEQGKKDITAVLQKYHSDGVTKTLHETQEIVAREIHELLETKYFWLSWGVELHNSLTLTAAIFGPLLAVYKHHRDVTALFVPTEECSGDFTRNFAKLTDLQNRASCKTDNLDEAKKYYDAGNLVRNGIFWIRAVSLSIWVHRGQCFTFLDIACRDKHQWHALFALKKGY